MHNNFVLDDSIDVKVMATKPFTIEDAHIAAVHLLFLPDVHAIDLHGSIARENTGNDVDLVIVVESMDRYRSFVEAVMKELEPPPFHGGASARFAAARTAFGEKDFDRTIDRIRATSKRSKDLVSSLDLFVMPNGWQKQADTLQRDLPHRDPSFVKTIASYARRITAR